MALGIFLAGALETSVGVRVSKGRGDGMGEIDLSELGDVLPPQPKKVPSLEVPGEACDL